MYIIADAMHLVIHLKCQYHSSEPWTAYEGGIALFLILSLLSVMKMIKIYYYFSIPDFVHGITCYFPALWLGLFFSVLLTLLNVAILK